MKLYLSSYRVPTPNDLFDLIGKKYPKIALIPNAKDYYAKKARDFKINAYVKYFDQLGFETSVVDLRDFNNQILKSKLKQNDIVWLCGGNTFCLRHAITNSGLDEVLRELLNEGLVYGGDSAGALIVGPTLKGVEFADEPEFAESVSFSGMNIVPQMVIPHVDNTEFKDAIKQMIELHKTNPKLVKLNDNQALIIDDKNIKDISLEVTDGYNFPIMWIGEVGHNVENIMLPIGAEAYLDATKLNFEIKE